MRRNLGGQSEANDFDGDSSSSLMLKGGGLRSASVLLEYDPPFKGEVKKESGSWLTWMFPCWYDKFQTRYLILAGKYLFRYVNSDSTTVKGAPIDLESGHVELVPGEPCQFCITSLRKSYNFIAPDAQSCLDWVKAIRRRQADNQKESMGHMRPTPCSVYANRVARGPGRPDPSATDHFLQTASNPLNTHMH